jgi:hypothetical protein
MTRRSAGDASGVAWVREHTRQWFALAALMCLVGFVVLSGAARQWDEIAAFVVFLAASIRYIGLALRDPDRAQMLTRTNLRGFETDMAVESSRARARRAAKRRARGG